MNWYEPIGCSNTVEDPLVMAAGMYDLKGFDEWEFTKGKRIEGWNPTAYMQAREDGEPDDVLQHCLGDMFPIFSSRLQKALGDAGIEGIQYLPIRILRPDGSPVEGFAIANILNMVPALDFEKTRVIEYFDETDRPDRKGEIIRIRGMVLKRSALQGYDILRVKEYKLRIIVSSRFVEVFRLGRFTGYSFDKVTLS